ncbi:hypothetical protein PENTCL1PPCAC_19819 [Pristionchus entomophagus]|uniref:Uncharacterized protein n=1 Tax=Pristionchus entomophagus TaxID=358040 RepID=A0AAV5TUH3_9BILA|nr:hypothetical protein PENTCL1PPCAC_19819 [Pristionchus entomophagus]
MVNILLSGDGSCSLLSRQRDLLLSLHCRHHRVILREMRTTVRTEASRRRSSLVVTSIRSTSRSTARRTTRWCTMPCGRNRLST